MGSRSEISWHRFQLILLLLALKCCAGVSGSNPDLNEIVPPVSKTDPLDDTESLSKDSAIAKPTDPPTHVILPDENDSVSSYDVDTPAEDYSLSGADIPAKDKTLSDVDNSAKVETPPGEANSAKVETPPGEDNSAKHKTSPGEDNSAKVENPPGEDNSAKDETPPGEDNSAKVETPPGEDNSVKHKTSPGEDNSAKDETPPGEENSAKVETSPSEDNSDKVETPPGEDNSAKDEAGPGEDNSAKDGISADKDAAADKDASSDTADTGDGGGGEQSKDDSSSTESTTGEVSVSPTIPVDAEKPDVEDLIPNNSISTIKNDLITDFSQYEVYFNEKVEGANFSFLRLFVMSSILFCCLYVGYFYRQKIKRYFFGNKNEVYYQPLRAMQRNAAD